MVMPINWIDRETEGRRERQRSNDWVGEKQDCCFTSKIINNITFPFPDLSLLTFPEIKRIVVSFAFQLSECLTSDTVDIRFTGLPNSSVLSPSYCCCCTIHHHNSASHLHECPSLDLPALVQKSLSSTVGFSIRVWMSA